MSKQETITVNGKTYVEVKEGQEIKPAVETDPLEALKAEARKYKSAEEFVKAQGTRTGVEVKEGQEIKPAVETDHVIIIAQRGWIFEGYKDKSVADKIQLLNANVVRSWSNGKGIGGLTQKALKNDYTLDPVGTVSFPNEAIIAQIDIVEW